MRRLFQLSVIALLLSGMAGLAVADTLPFKKSRLLLRGMSVAQVLYLVGPPDHRQLRDAHWTNMQSWYYIPAATDRDPWETVIHFDAWGNIQNVDREKIIGRPYRQGK